LNKDFQRLTFIDALWDFFNGLAAPFLTIYFNGFGGLNEVGISVALRYTLQGIIPLLFSKFMKKRKSNMKLWFLIGQIFESLRVMLFIFASSINDIYIIQLLGGVTYSLISPAYTKIFVKTGDDEDDDAFRVRSGIINLIIGISALLSGFIINYFGFIPVFASWAIIELIYGFYIYFLV
jgi:hypothetical protein